MRWSCDIAVAVTGKDFHFHNPALGSDPLVIPAYCAKQQGTHVLLALGEEAFQMLGKAPPNIQVSAVLEEGMCMVPDAASAILRFGLKKICPRSLLAPR